MAGSAPTQSHGLIIQIYNWILLAIGVGIVYGVATYVETDVRCYQVRSWPRATAVLTDGQVFEKTETRSSIKGTTVRTTKSVEIEYHYSVDHKEYIGRRFSPEADRVPEIDWLKLILDEKLHETHEVYYNPNDPSDSYFTHAYESPSVFKCVVVAFLGILGIAMIWFEVRNIRRNHASPTTTNPVGQEVEDDEDEDEEDHEHPKREPEKQNP
jgi:hypothetical protein